jgi:hypothetical protein
VRNLREINKFSKYKNIRDDEGVSPEKTLFPLKDGYKLLKNELIPRPSEQSNSFSEFYPF